MDALHDTASSQETLAPATPVVAGDELEMTHGKITGKALYRVKDVDMAWQNTPEGAIDVARRVRAFVASGALGRKP